MQLHETAEAELAQTERDIPGTYVRNATPSTSSGGCFGLWGRTRNRSIPVGGITHNFKTKIQFQMPAVLQLSPRSSVGCRLPICTTNTEHPTQSVRRYGLDAALRSLLVPPFPPIPRLSPDGYPWLWMHKRTSTSSRW